MDPEPWNRAALRLLRGQPNHADHAFALLATHGDAGTPAQLEAIAIECDRNGGAMASRLRDLARRLRERFPVDRPLPDPAATALRNRAIST